jgi:hypothetical protein
MTAVVSSSGIATKDDAGWDRGQRMGMGFFSSAFRVLWLAPI